MKEVARSIFKGFASVKLAVFLLLVLAVIFAIGTFIESAYGAEAAKALVYRSPWFSLFLILLALNVAAAALDRYPWKKKHVGFVITHLGIILMLAGSLVTRAFGIEGQMAIQEGETSSRMMLGEAIIELSRPHQDSFALFAVPGHVFPWQGKETLRVMEEAGFTEEESPTIYLRRFFPKARREEKIEESKEGPAALEVLLKNSWMSAAHWLFLDDPTHSRIMLGPAELRFTREPIAQAQKGADEEGYLEFQFEGHSKESSVVKVPIRQNVSKSVRLSGTPYSVIITKVIKDAVVSDKGLLDQSEEWNNPACELTLKGNGIEEKHIIFQKFPDFPTMHGFQPSQAGVKIYYRREGGEASTAKNELRFIWREEVLPDYQVKKGEEIMQGSSELGKEFETGWMDFKFQLQKYYPHARISSSFSEVPLASQEEGHIPAAELELEYQGERKTFWLGQGDREITSLGGEDFSILFGVKTLPVGFKVTLRDFRVENYPGTSRPASFESDVTLKDPSTGTLRDLTIRMNQPLKHRGFKVFQSGYQQPPGEPEVSIFSVAKDPGIFPKYLGAIVLVGGTITMFYTRKFSNKSEVLTK